MANLTKQKQKKLLEAAIVQNPKLAEGKRLCGILALAWVLVRVLALIAELLLVFSVDPKMFSVTNVVALFIVVWFSYCIYNGMKACAILPIIGGALMTAQIFTQKIYLMLTPAYIPIARIYALAFILASLAQLVLPIILLASSSSREYFNAAQAASKEAASKL